MDGGLIVAAVLISLGDREDYFVNCSGFSLIAFDAFRKPPAVKMLKSPTTSLAA